MLLAVISIAGLPPFCFPWLPSMVDWTTAVIYAARLKNPTKGICMLEVRIRVRVGARARVSSGV